MKTQPKTYSKPGTILWAARRLWRLDRRFVLIVAGKVPVEVAQPLVQSYFSKALIDRIGAGAVFAQLLGVAACFVAMLASLTVLSQWLAQRACARGYYPTFVYQEELEYEWNDRTDFENTQRQEYAELYGYASRDSSQGNCSPEFVWQDLQKALIDALGIVSYASLLVMVDPAIFAIVAAVSVLSYFTTRWQASYREKHKHEWEKESRRQGYLQGLSENFQAAKDVKLYGLEGWLGDMMRHYQDHILFWEKKCSLRGLWAAMLAGVGTLLQDGAAYIFLLSQLLQGRIGVGDFVFYFGIVTSIAAFLTGIMADAATLSSRAEKIAWYRRVFDHPKRFNHGPGCALPTGPVKIEFRGVRYRYEGAQEDTLKGIDLTLEAGESIALVGINGAGKTTLVKLLCGLFTPTEGEILVNGRRIDEYNIEEYYSLISAVFQEVKPVAFTICEFLITADPDRATAEADAVAALQAAGLWEKVASLPNGIHTHLMKGVYDDGVDLSGGEMQKLLLARAIYKNGSILVLDEPTAALDPIAENALYLQYRDLTRGKTAVYISHRFASTRFCDRILLLENGQILESGTHEELMAKKGRYAEMFDVQSKYYREGDIHA